MSFSIHEQIAFSNNMHVKGGRAPRGSYTHVHELNVRFRFHQGKIFFGYRQSSTAAIGIKDFKSLATANEEERKHFLDSNYSKEDIHLIKKLLNLLDAGLVNLPSAPQIYYLSKFGAAPGFEFIKVNKTRE